MGAELRVGAVVAGYRVEARIGRGGMGEVYRAEQLRLGRQVALKVLAGDLAGDEGFRERFIRESKLAASLAHPNIVPIYDAGEDGYLLFIAMQLVESDLAALLRKDGPLAPPRAVSIVEQIGAALDAAHARGLIHRDVKPANILIAPSEDGSSDHALLSDFGLTKRTASLESLTGTGQLVGTIDYVAPEQIRGEALDGRADLYSLGCVLFECLSGAAPFRKDSDVAVLYTHLSAPVPGLPADGPEIPAGMADVVATAMAKDPKARYRTGTELAHAAKAALERRPVGPAPPSRRGGPRYRRRVLLAAAALLVVGAIAAAMLVLGSPAPRTLPTPTPGVADQRPGVVHVDVAKPGAVSTIVVQRVLSVALFGGRVWVSSPDALREIDPVTGEIVAQDPLPGDYNVVAAGMGAVWVSSGSCTGPAAGAYPCSATIFRADDQGGLTELRKLHVPVDDLAAGDGALWLVDRRDGEVLAFDPASRTVIGDLQVNSSGTGLLVFSRSVAVVDGSVWVLDRAGGVVTRIDARSRTVLGTITMDTPGAVAASDDVVWVTSQTKDTVTEFQADGTVLATVPVGHRPRGVSAEAGWAWVVDRGDHALVRVDRSTDRVSKTIDLGPGAYGDLASEGEAVWVSRF